MKKSKSTILPYKLQFFAEEGAAAGADNGNGDGAGAAEGTSGGSEGGTQTFDDILKDPKNQSEFDKKVAKALETAKGKWASETQLQIETAKTEAEKLAKMNADQKAAYETQKKIDELTGREKNITTRELKAQAYETLAEKGLPKDLVEILNYESADTCNKSIESVSKAFQSAVEKAVNEKLRGSGAPGGAQGSGSKPDYDKMSDSEYYASLKNKK